MYLKTLLLAGLLLVDSLFLRVIPDADEAAAKVRAGSPSRAEQFRNLLPFQ
jgi:hypothetical protein